MANSYPLRYVATFAIEAATPLKIGSSDIDMLQDAPVQKDWNGLPMILGTSIAGVMRKAFDTAFANDIFGDEYSKKSDNKGSRLVISNALLCDSDMQVHETLLTEKSDFLEIFDTLPVRDHVRITDKGVADTKNSGKFDEEVIYKGSRFKFRLELAGDESDAQAWETLLKTINTGTFRLGGGTTRGFGDIRVLHEYSGHDLFEVTDEKYIQAPSSLNTHYQKRLPEKSNASTYDIYKLTLHPDDFFMFGSGFGDDDADMTPVYEHVVDYENGKLTEEKVLIPASSVKGAIAHRTAFHFNRLLGHTIESGTGKTGEENEAVRTIFGEKKDEQKGQKGRILISDCFLDRADEKVFDHVSIDRFTGGAIESALFQEKTVAGIEIFHIEILLKQIEDSQITEAFEDALRDICTGRLPLGGATTKGHGVFHGKIIKNGETL